MTIVPFDKMQGSGNDFILVDNRAGIVPEGKKIAFVRGACVRASSVGADGVIFLENDDEYDFRWHFFNADGSEAEMCGNGARCVARFARKVGAAGETMVFRTVAGPIDATLVPGGAKVRLPDAEAPRSITALPLESGGLDIFFINTGVPHVVVPVEDLEAADVRGIGAAIRYHEQFKPAGTNCNFMARDGENAIAVRTYERGVENETLACGTGSVACAVVARGLYGMDCPIAVRTRSGIRLAVDYGLEGGAVRDVYLEGPADCVYEGRYFWEE